MKDISSAKYFYIDSRSLNLFRILISLVVLHDLGVRLSDFTAHYTDIGVLPFEVWKEHFYVTGKWTLAGLSNNSVYTLLVFVAGILAAIMLLLGKHVRWMAAIVWVALLSVQNRNPLLYQGGDDMLRMVLFWFIFIPQPSATEKGQALQISGWATMALLLQVLFPLQFSGLYKGHYEWWLQGSALNYALQLDQIARPAGLWLREYPEIMRFLTRIVFLAELFVLPIFLFPYFREQMRSATFFILLLFSTGIISLIMIGLFPLCILACSVLFIPTTMWQRIRPAKRVETYTTQNSILVAWGKQFGLMFLFVLVVWWNISDLRGSYFKFPDAFRVPVYALGLNQSWGMFAPTVFKEDGWLVNEATLSNGKQVDLNNNNSDVDFTKPSYVLSRFKNDRWRKYTEQIFLYGNQHLRVYYANYLINTYNLTAAPEEQINSLNIYYMLELTKANSIYEPEKVLLYSTTQ